MNRKLLIQSEERCQKERVILHFQYLTCALEDFPELESLFPRVQGTLRVVSKHLPPPSMSRRELWSQHEPVLSAQLSSQTWHYVQPCEAQQQFQAMPSNTPTGHKLTSLFYGSQATCLGTTGNSDFWHVFLAEPFSVCSRLCPKTKLICIAGCFYCLQGQQ